MRSFIVLTFFVACLLLVIGIYEQKLDIAEKNKQVEYKFVPRTFYEEQMSNGVSVSETYSTMFKTESPWFDRTVGSIIDIPRPFETEAASTHQANKPKL